MKIWVILETVLVLPGIKKMGSVIATQGDELCRIANPNPDIFKEWAIPWKARRIWMSCRGGLQQGFEFVGRQRPGEQEALAKVATRFGQQLALLLGLHAFCRYFHAQCMRHHDDGLA